MPGDDVLWHPLAAWHAGMISRVNDVGDLMSGDTRSIKEGLELKSFTESKTQTPAESQSTEAAAVCCIVLPRIACQRSSCQHERATSKPNQSHSYQQAPRLIYQALAMRRTVRAVDHEACTQQESTHARR